MKALKINLKVYFNEIEALNKYLKSVKDNVEAVKGNAHDSDFVLAEWLDNYLVKKYIAMYIKEYRTAQKIAMPISVARILWRNWQNELIVQELTLLLGGIDKALTDGGFKPVAP